MKTLFQSVNSLRAGCFQELNKTFSRCNEYIRNATQLHYSLQNIQTMKMELGNSFPRI